MEGSTTTAASCSLKMKNEDGEEEEFLDCSSSNGNDEEQRKVASIRALLQSQHPSTTAEEVDDPMIRRFLRARDMNIDKASALLLKYLSWRRSYQFISPADVWKHLSDKMVFLQGLDKQGRPIVVIYAARHKPSNAGLQDFKRFTVYWLDKACARMPEGQEKFVCIADLEGWGFSNCDIRGYIAALTILQDCYPERLGKLFMIHVPYIFMAAWKIVYPFIDSNTRQKIVFVDNKEVKPTLLAEIDESQLPETYGGKLTLVPIQDS